MQELMKISKMYANWTKYFINILLYIEEKVLSNITSYNVNEENYQFSVFKSNMENIFELIKGKNKLLIREINKLSI